MIGVSFRCQGARTKRFDRPSQRVRSATLRVSMWYYWCFPLEKPRKWTRDSGYCWKWRRRRSSKPVSPLHRCAAAASARELANVSSDEHRGSRATRFGPAGGRSPGSSGYHRALTNSAITAIVDYFAEVLLVRPLRGEIPMKLIPVPPGTWAHGLPLWPLDSGSVSSP